MGFSAAMTPEIMVRMAESSGRQMFCISLLHSSGLSARSVFRIMMLSRGLPTPGLRMEGNKSVTREPSLCRESTW